EQPDGPEEEHHKGNGKSGVVDVTAESDVVRVAPTGDQGDHEDGRHCRRSPKTQVGALLGPQLAQLPAVDGQHAGHQAGAPASCRASASPAAGSAPSSVSWKKRSSSVAWCGVSSSIGAPDSASASESAATASSSLASK